MDDVATVTLGGMTVLSIQMVVMSQARRLTVVGRWSERIYDLFNYPIAFTLMAIANPPWPYWHASEWQSYIGMSLALATLASVTAKKTADAKARETP